MVAIVALCETRLNFPCLFVHLVGGDLADGVGEVWGSPGLFVHLVGGDLASGVRGVWESPGRCSLEVMNLVLSMHVVCLV